MVPKWLSWSDVQSPTHASKDFLEPVKNDIKSSRREKIADLKESSDCSAAVEDAMFRIRLIAADRIFIERGRTTHSALQWDAESGNGQKGHLAASENC